PDIGQAAVWVLRAAGFDVLLPSPRVCCGLTGLSIGQLKAAQRKLRYALRMVEPVVSAGLPMLVLEPSCAALFRSDATELLPDDADARRLADNTYTLAEPLAKFAPDWEVPKAKEGEQAALQVHCHQHAVMVAGPDAALLRATGAAITLLDAGCCG